METRDLGQTGHESTVATFGAIALNWLEQEGADQLVELALERGVNHFDVAPTYGDAELKLGPKLRQHREEIYLGCKTQERDYEARATNSSARWIASASTTSISTRSTASSMSPNSRRSRATTARWRRFGTPRMRD